MSFKNLSNYVHPDEQMGFELERARIPAVEGQSDGPIMIGKLPGPFTFVRARYDWSVEGPVPLEVAEELYADPVGKDDIRLAYCAEDSSPADQAVWLVPNVMPEEVSTPRDQALKEFLEAYDSCMAPEGWCVVPADKAELLDARQYVISYNIVNEVGLRVFVDMLRSHNLVTDSEPVAA